MINGSILIRISFHSNILKFTDDAGVKIRPFASIEEMHEVMIERWNSVVKPQDKVYHLGDVTFRYGGEFTNLMSRLRGHKRLIVGNHDKIWDPNLIRSFDKVDLWKGFKDFNFTASHFPLNLDTLRDGAFNVHGHVHANSLKDKNYINVSVEVRNYTPVNIDEIVQEMR